MVGKVTRHGIIVNTTGIVGFSLLWAMSRFRPLRPRPYRFPREQEAAEACLDRAVRIGRDPERAREVINCQRVLKGYGATHEHGRESFGLLMTFVDRLSAGPIPRTSAARVCRLRDPALADEDGVAIRAAPAAEAEPARGVMAAVG